MKSFISDLLSIGFSKILIIFFSLFTSIIIARTLGPEKNGTIAALLVYPSLFMAFGSLGIRQSITYFLGKNIYSEEQIKIAVTQIWFFSSFMSIIFCYLLIKYFSNSGGDLWLVLLAIIPIPFSLFNTYNSGIFLGKNQIGLFNQINWIPPFTIFFLTLILVLILKFDINGYLIAIIGGPVFISFLLLFKNDFINSFSLKVDWKIIQNMLKLGLVYAVSLLIVNLNYKLDIIFLDKLSTPYETGIYSKGSTIIQYLWQIPMLLSTIVFARSAVAKNDLEFSIKVAQLLRLSFIAISLGSLVLFLFSDLVILTMFGDEYRESISALNILLPGVLLLTIFKVMNMDLAGKGKPWVALYAMGPALIANILFNSFLIPQYGADGASVASTISYSIAAILFLFFYSSASGISIKQILFYKRSDFSPIFNFLQKGL